MATWAFIASVLAAFDVSPALDDSGNPIDARYAVSGITNITTWVKGYVWPNVLIVSVPVDRFLSLVPSRPGLSK